MDNDDAGKTQGQPGSEIAVQGRQSPTRGPDFGAQAGGPSLDPGLTTPITRREALANLVAPLLLSVPVAAALRVETAVAQGLIEVRVPDLSNFSHVPVVAVWVKAGDRVVAGATLLTIESTKATMDVPAPASGQVVAVFVAVGDTVSEGDLVATLAVDPQAVPALDAAGLAVLGGALAAAGAKLLDARARGGAGELPDGDGAGKGEGGAG